jgi:acetyl-CoA carboxylase biotin carboxyl carrier protein
MPIELNKDDLLSLINTVSTSSLSHFSLEYNGMKIWMEANKPDTGAKTPIEMQMNSINLSSVHEKTTTPIEQDKQGLQIKAPLVGTFYRSPDVDSAPYVSIGDHVNKGQPLGIIEAMKLINEIESDVEGYIEMILVNNGQVVGFNDPLFVIKA